MINALFTDLGSVHRVILGARVDIGTNRDSRGE